MSSKYTRDNVKNSLVRLVQSTPSQTRLNLKDFVDELYDDIDSKRCENCATYYDGQCSLVIVYGLTYCSLFKHK